MEVFVFGVGKEKRGTENTYNCYFFYKTIEYPKNWEGFRGPVRAHTNIILCYSIYLSKYQPPAAVLGQVPSPCPGQTIPRPSVKQPTLRPCIILIMQHVDLVLY